MDLMSNVSVKHVWNKPLALDGVVDMDVYCISVQMLFLLFNFFPLLLTALSYDTFFMYQKRKRFGVPILDGP